MTGASLVAASHLRSDGAGDGELGPDTVARRISIETSRGRRTRQRAAAVGRWRQQRLRRSPPRFGAMVCRHDPDRTLRRCSDGRRRFHVARRRNQFRFATGTSRGRAARRARRRRRPARRRPHKSRPAAGRGRAVLRPPDDPRLHHVARRQSRSGPCAALRAHRRQSVAHRVGSVGQYPAVQSATAARGIGARRRHRGQRRAGGRTRRRGLLRHARPAADAAAAQDRGAHAERRNSRPRARGRRMEREVGQELAGRRQHHRHQARLRRAGRGRSLRRLRSAHRARKHYAAGEDHQ